MGRWTLLVSASAAAAILVAVLLLSDYGDEPVAVPTEKSPRQEFFETPRWQKRDCSSALVEALEREAFDGRAECGWFRAPESRGARRKVQLSTVRLRPNRGSELPPMLLLPGGPGDAFIPRLAGRLPYLLPLSRGRELLFMDQRGTGLSLPRLDCPDEMRDRDALARCFRGYHADLDPGSFSTAESVSDLERLLQTLRIRKVVLYGVSYGTLLAQYFAAAHPERVERLILDSPIPREVDLLASVGWNAQGALRNLLSACVAHRDSSCPFKEGLEGLARLVARLNSNQTKGAATGREFVRSLSSLMFSPTSLGFIPYLISEGEAGRFDDYYRLSGSFAQSDLAFGVHLSIQCGEFLPLSSKERLEEGDAKVRKEFREALSARAYFDYCSEWKISPAKRDRWGTPNVRTLVMSGAFDHLTPHSYAKKVAKHVPQSILAVHPAVGHGVAFSACGARMVADFLASSPSSADFQCSGDIEELRFHNRGPTSAELQRIRSELRFRL